MLPWYCTRVLAGTHSTIHPCTISSLIISATSTHTKKHFGVRAFSNSIPKLWNSLPQTIRETGCSAVFRRRLKIHLFSELSMSDLNPSITIRHCTPSFSFVLSYHAFSINLAWLKTSPSIQSMQACAIEMDIIIVIITIIIIIFIITIIFIIINR